MERGGHPFGILARSLYPPALRAEGARFRAAVPEDLLQRKTAKSNGDPRAWIVWQVYVNNRSLVLILCMGRCKDEGLKRKFIGAVTADPTLGLREHAIRGETYCKLYRKRIDTWKEDREPAFETVRDQVVRALDELLQQVSRLPAIAGKS